MTTVAIIDPPATNKNNYAPNPRPTQPTQAQPSPPANPAIANKYTGLLLGFFIKWQQRDRPLDVKTQEVVSNT